MDSRAWAGERFDALVIRDLPAGARLSVGAYDPAIAGWALRPQDLSALAILPPPALRTDFTLTLMGIALRPGDANAARILARLPVTLAEPAWRGAGADACDGPRSWSHPRIPTLARVSGSPDSFHQRPTDRANSRLNHIRIGDFPPSGRRSQAAPRHRRMSGLRHRSAPAAMVAIGRQPMDRASQFVILRPS